MAARFAEPTLPPHSDSMRRKPHAPSEAALAYDGPSKSQLKRDMHDLQDLGSALLELPDEQLDRIEMDERLRDALRELRRLTTHEARRRQSQYVGKLLRVADTAPFQKALEFLHEGKARDAATVGEAERWRERLIADDTALAEWITAYPAGDTRQLRALIRDVRRDQLAAAMPGGNKASKHAYRELYLKVRAVLLAAAR